MLRLPTLPTLGSKDDPLQAGQLDAADTASPRVHPPGSTQQGRPLIGKVMVQVLLDRAEGFIRVVGAHEDAIFQKRMRNLARDKRRRENQGPVGCPSLLQSASCCHH